MKSHPPSRCHVRASILILLALTGLVVAGASTVAAEEKYSGAALEWTLDVPLPSSVKIGEAFDVHVRLSNYGTVNLTGANVTTVLVTYDSKTLDTASLELDKDASQVATFNITIDEDVEANLRLTASYVGGSIDIYDQFSDDTNSLGTVDIQTKYNQPALEWTLEGPLPTQVETDEEFTIQLRFLNEGNVEFVEAKRVTIGLAYKGKDLDSSVMWIAKKGTNTTTYKAEIKAEDPNAELKINAQYRGNFVHLYNSETGEKTNLIGFVKVEHIEEPFNWTPIIIIVVVIAAIGGAFYAVKLRRRKAEEARRAAEEVRRKEVIRKKEEEIAKKIEVRQVAGKHPRDYYILHRQKYTTFKPSGMTSSGLTILKHEKTRAEMEAEQERLCPKCGTKLPASGDCPRCYATEKIEAVRHQIRKHKSTAPVDFKDAEALLRKAEHRLNWSDYSMANELVDKADAKMQEIWSAAERGMALESTVEEYTEAKGPTLDAKVIALEGETTAPETAEPAPPEDGQAPAPEEMPRGKPCPECGQPMEGEECLLCNFESNIDAVWTVIEKGEMDGADMAEPKDLCRHANQAKERGSDELAVRYLRRAISISKETYHGHARSKTEGIIQFTKALIDQVKTMGEDVSLAEQMISQADAAMESGEYESARSMAAKADGYLKQMREDSYKKRINELLPMVEQAAATNAQVKELLGKAKKLIEAKELEGAVDILESAEGML